MEEMIRFILYILAFMILFCGCTAIKNRQHVVFEIAGIPLPTGTNLISVGFELENSQIYSEDSNENPKISSQKQTKTNKKSRNPIREILGVLFGGGALFSLTRLFGGKRNG